MAEARDGTYIAGASIGARNPAWTRDELILALNVYLDHPTAAQLHPAVIELSALLNQMWTALGSAGRPTLRNASGVAMKLSNFQRLDPNVLNEGRSGLAHGAKADKQVWDEFASDWSRLRSVAAAIRQALQSPAELLNIKEPDGEPEAMEGALLSRLHRYRERNGGLAKRVRERVLAQFGKLQCEACDRDYQKLYGERATACMEVHHKLPLAELPSARTTKLDELILLCANCHRTVHASRPWLSVDELKQLVGRPFLSE